MARKGNRHERKKSYKRRSMAAKALNQGRTGAYRHRIQELKTPKKPSMKDLLNDVEEV